MPIDLVVATRNKNKLTEIRDLLADLDFNVLSIADFPGIPEIVEDGDTFEENAEKKAVQVAQITKKLTIADDSGLEIDYLGGKPGIHSARFAGENATDEDRNRKVLDALKGVPGPERTARFKCAVAIVNHDAAVEIVVGTREGEIALEPRGARTRRLDKSAGFDGRGSGDVGRAEDGDHVQLPARVRSHRALEEDIAPRAGVQVERLCTVQRVGEGDVVVGDDAGERLGDVAHFESEGCVGHAGQGPNEARLGWRSQ